MKKKFKMYARVKMKKDRTTEAWNVQGKEGTVIGPDPLGHNPDVRSVMLDDGFTLFAVKGIHISHLEEVTE